MDQQKQQQLELQIMQLKSRILDAQDFAEWQRQENEKLKAALGKLAEIVGVKPVENEDGTQYMDLQSVIDRAQEKLAA